MFDISKMRPKSILGQVKAQKFSRCLHYTHTQLRTSLLGVYWFHSILPSVCPAVSAEWLAAYFMDLYSYVAQLQTTRGDVLRTICRSIGQRL